MPRARTAPGTLILIHAFPLNARVWAALSWPITAGALSPTSAWFRSRRGRPAGLLDRRLRGRCDRSRRCTSRRGDRRPGSIGGFVAFAVFRHALALRARARPRGHASAGRYARGRGGRKKMLGRAEKGPAAIATHAPKLLGETTAPTTRTSSSACDADHVQFVGSVAGAIRALMTRPDSTPILPTFAPRSLVGSGHADASALGQMQREIARSSWPSPQRGHLSSLEDRRLHAHPRASLIGCSREVILCDTDAGLHLPTSPVVAPLVAAALVATPRAGENPLGLAAAPFDQILIPRSTD